LISEFGFIDVSDYSISLSHFSIMYSVMYGVYQRSRDISQVRPITAQNPLLCRH